MKEQFRDKLHLNKRSRELLTTIIQIVESFSLAGYVLTLRQLYYQLVSQGIIPNEQKEYAKISGLLVKARMAGIVDWDAIEDRLRVPYIPYSVTDVADALADTLAQYRLNRMEGQQNYIEVLVEKDALSSVLKKITEYYHIHLGVNRGYSSCTAMYDLSKRIKEQEVRGKKAHILYLGDHDPSGVDMIRDIRERLQTFGVNPEVHRIALTKDQIDTHNPPPNPAKKKDTRSKAYIQEFGDMSWEVDALNPAILYNIVRDAVEGLIDRKIFDQVLQKEESDRKKLSEFIGSNG